MIKKKKQMYMVIGAFILILMLFTTAYAFFNYTRTGTANVIKTGRIAFNADQGNNTVTLSDLFPITVGANEEVTASTPGVGSLSIHVTGDTSYSEGIEYLIKAVNVTGDNGTNLPISIQINYQANTGKSIGTEDEDYFTNRGGNTSVYKVLSNDTIEEGKELVVGYIAPDVNGTGIDGTLTIMAYLDARNIAITDTYPEGTVHTVKTTEYSSQNCEAALTGVENANTYCASASSLQNAIDNGLLTSEQITLLVNAGIVEEYTDGTTDTWVNGRTVLTTEQWNSLQASGVSFQIKAEANEGTWVPAPPPPAYQTIGSLQTLETVSYGKIYTGSDPDNYVIFNNEQWRIIGVYGNNLKIIKATPAITSQVFDSRGSESFDSWDGSTIQDYLLNTYYPTLSEAARNMIYESGTWYTGSASRTETAQSAYTSEQDVSWAGKIGLISSYEYLYAAGSSCQNVSGAYGYFNPTCRNTDWLFTTLKGSGNYNSWTVNNYNEVSRHILYVNGYDGNISDEGQYNPLAASPVVYLKSDVVITGGTGEAGGNEYTLGFNN